MEIYWCLATCCSFHTELVVWMTDDSYTMEATLPNRTWMNTCRISLWILRSNFKDLSLVFWQSVFDHKFSYFVTAHTENWRGETALFLTGGLSDMGRSLCSGQKSPHWTRKLREHRNFTSHGDNSCEWWSLTGWRRQIIVAAQPTSLNFSKHQKLSRGGW